MPESSPLCADAYVLLAQETAKDLDQTIEICRQGVEAGEKALGKTAFRENAGRFWGLLETRLYMCVDSDAGCADLGEPVNRDSAAAHTIIRFKTARTKSNDRRLVLTSSLYRPAAENAP